eukprot:scaffold30339_cov32-Tisochrysis_lutea.AAC.2
MDLLFAPESRLADDIPQLKRLVIGRHIEADALVGGVLAWQCRLPQEDVDQCVACCADQVQRVAHPRRVIA